MFMILFCRFTKMQTMKNSNNNKNRTNSYQNMAAGMNRRKKSILKWYLLLNECMMYVACSLNFTRREWKWKQRHQMQQHNKYVSIGAMSTNNKIQVKCFVLKWNKQKYYYSNRKKEKQNWLLILNSTIYANNNNLPSDFRCEWTSNIIQFESGNSYYSLNCNKNQSDCGQFEPSMSFWRDIGPKTQKWF